MLKTSPNGKLIQAADDIIWKSRGCKIFKIFSSNYRWEKDNEYEITTSIVANQQNVTITLPVTISIMVDDDFNPHQLLEKVAASANQDGVIIFDEFITKSFFRSIQGQRPQIVQLLSEYTGQDSNRTLIMGKVMELLTFPDRLFDNFSDWKITIDDQPTISVCKGSLCSK